MNDELLRYNLTREELLDIKHLLTLLHDGARPHIRDVEDAIYRIDHVLECNVEMLQTYGE